MWHASNKAFFVSMSDKEIINSLLRLLVLWTHGVSDKFHVLFAIAVSNFDEAQKEFHIFLYPCCLYSLEKWKHWFFFFLSFFLSYISYFEKLIKTYHDQLYHKEQVSVGFPNNSTNTVCSSFWNFQMCLWFLLPSEYDWIV